LLKNFRHTIVKTFNTALLYLVLSNTIYLFSQSISKGNTYIHGPKETTIFKTHNFSTGGNGIMPGIVGTKRNGPTYFSFAGSSSAINASDTAHVDGYVKNHSNLKFTFPVGDNGKYGPVSMIAVDSTKLSSPISAAYFRTNPDNAITTSLKGNDEGPLPLGAPFSLSMKGPGITSVCFVEYWDVDGKAPIKLKLHWSATSQIDVLTSNMLMGLRIVGWNGSMWVDIPATIDTGSDLTNGTITSNEAIIPFDFTAFTFGVSCELMDIAFLNLPNTINLCEGEISTIDIDVLLGGQIYNPDFYLEKFDGNNWIVDSGPNNTGIFRFTGLSTNTPNVRYRIRAGIGGCARYSNEIILQSYKPSTLACITSINASVNKDCELLVTPGMILASYQGSTGFFDVVVMNSSGNIVSNPIQYPGNSQTFMVKIVDRCSGNSCWSNINLEDKTPPTIVKRFENQAFACHLFDDVKSETASDHFGNLGRFGITTPPEVRENCGNFTSQFLDNEIDIGCGAKQITRKWTFTDNGGNKVSSQQVFTFNPLTINDLAAPVETVVLDCKNTINPIDLQTIFDNPSTIDDTNSQGLVENNEGANYAGFTYLAQGKDGIKHRQLVSDQICNLFTSYTDEEISSNNPGGCFKEKKVLRKWFLLDECSNDFKIYNQYIILKDTIGPEFNINPILVSITGINCSATVNVDKPFDIMDNCSDISKTKWYIIPPAGSILKGIHPDYTIEGLAKGLHLLTYVMEDCAGNKTTKSTTIQVNDNVAPTVIANQNIIVSLSESQNGKGYGKLLASAVDNSSFDACGLTRIEIRRKIGSSCENIGQNGHNNNITFSDHTASNSVTSWSHVDNNKSDTDEGKFVTFCCEDIEIGKTYGLHYVEMRIWDDANNNGNAGDSYIINGTRDNFNTVWVQVRVEHKKPPVLSCPSDILVQCDSSFDLNTTSPKNVTALTTGIPGVQSLCQNDYKITYLDKWISGGTCNVGILNRTFSIIDSPISCVQKITVNPHPTPFTVTFNSKTIEWSKCDFSIDDAKFASDLPIITNSPCATISQSINIDTFSNISNACKKWIVTYSYHNDCTNETIKAPSITYYYKDTISPSIDIQHLALNENASCSSNVNIKARLSDQTICNDKELLSSEVLLDIDGNDTIDFISSYLLKEISVNQNWQKTTPGQQAYNKIKSLYSAYTFANEISFSYNQPLTTNDSMLALSPINIDISEKTNKLIWVVRDNCGNTTNRTYDFTIDDKKAPTLSCISLTTKLISDVKPSIELWAKDFINNASDNCTAQSDLIYTFDSIAPLESLFANEHFFKKDLNGKSIPSNQLEFNNGLAQKWQPSFNSSAKLFLQAGLIEVPVYVWDKKGNASSCIANLTIINTDKLVPISGQVLTIDNKPKKGVKVTIDNYMIDFPQSTLTDTNGIYKFNVPLFSTYSLNSEYDGYFLEGVTTLDLVLIQRHITGLNTHDNSYKMIASDANNDSKISAADLVELRKLILGTSPTFRNKSWRIPIKNQNMELSNPFPYLETVFIDTLKNPTTTIDFVAVKIGDINGSLIGLKSGKTQNRSGNKLTLVADNVELNAGEKVYVPIYAENFRNMYGFQASIKLRDGVILEVVPNALDINESNIGKVRDNLFTISYSNDKVVSFENNTKLFTIVIETKNKSSLKEILSFGSEITHAESYDADMKVCNFYLNFRNPISTFTLYQNEPNPFISSTTIKWLNSKTEDLKFTITDEKGSLIMSKEINSIKGLNTLLINGSDLPKPGVYFYTFIGQNFNETGKFVRLE
jgi:hypothetical protein